ncbi:hypothetical protein [Flavobacterium sp. CSZ]|uniref:hypothetical protein n=1 Tax=Flavobacterium sp. CSZ TaxID=2783791 RepID=UPI00188DAA20|nr:hypothetical protein [Flavobacterium sp. CSZ]MBF4485803.1 hypothetical protein [Flavobacterium sp. CSZ]
MFTNVSWGSYLAAVGILLLIWYLVLILKFYSKDLRELFSGDKKFKFPALKKTSKNELEGQNSLSSAFSESFDTLEDAEELSTRIVQAVEESSQMSLSKEQFQNYLKMVLEEYPYVKISSLRENINNLIVSESEKHPQFYLTSAEADTLWEETTS